MRAANARDPAHGASETYGLVALAFAVAKLGDGAPKAKRVPDVLRIIRRIFMINPPIVILLCRLP